MSSTTSVDEQSNEQSNEQGGNQRHARTTTPEDLLSLRPGALEQRAVERRLPRKRPGLTAVLGGVVAAGALFAGGLLVGHATGSSATTSQAAGARAFGASGARPTGASGFGGGNVTSGTITSVDGSTVTLTASDGSTVKITTTTGTTVTSTTAATVADLGVGDTVTVVGQKDASGTVTARAITQGTAGAGGGQVPGQAPTS